MRGFAARSFQRSAFYRLALGVSGLAIASMAGAAHAQDASSTLGNPGAAETPPDPATDAPATDEAAAGDEIVVTGIRSSLRAAVDIKRNGQGVVDAISAEDIGKFPDTNLAESLQRITGVSISRENGEGSFVTVRGFGPEFNLVVLNGRQMPASTLGDGGSAPSSRSFDFANLASGGVAAVEVYKTGRASVPSGGIGSVINIRTPRPLDREGLRGSLAVKGVYDLSENGKTSVTPEVSGIFSNTFADGKFGVLLTGIYQKRDSSTNTYNSDFRDGYLGSENDWVRSRSPAIRARPGSPTVRGRPTSTKCRRTDRTTSPTSSASASTAGSSCNFEKMLGRPARMGLIDASFSIVTTPATALMLAQRLPHCDAFGAERIALIHYLSPNGGDGTAFYRHRSTGYETVDEARRPAYFDRLNAEVRNGDAPPSAYIAADTPLFERTMLADARYNRALLYPSFVLHSGAISADAILSPDPARGRLTVTAFMTVE